MRVQGYHNNTEDLHFFLAELFKPSTMMGIGIVTQMQEHLEKVEWMETNAPIRIGTQAFKYIWDVRMKSARNNDERNAIKLQKEWAKLKI